MNQRTAARLKQEKFNARPAGTIPARKIVRGMHVKLVNDDNTWTVLEHHPKDGHWWLHRWEDKQWVTTSARYTDMHQVVVK